jgi:hypothetical protein
MSAININLVLEQGTDYSVDFTITNEDGTPLNLTGYGSSCVMRKHYGATTSYPFNVSFVNRLTGQIRISMGSSTSAAASDGRYVYDIVLSDPNSLKSRPIQGNILVNPGVTL